MNRPLTPSVYLKPSARSNSPAMLKLNRSGGALMKKKKSLKGSSQPTRPMSQNEETTPQVLWKIRNRHQVKDSAVKSETVSQVIREYLLPMFKHHEKAKVNAHRSKSFGLTPKKDLKKAEFEGSVYSELKFSDLLSHEKSDILQKIKETESNFREIKQESLIISEEYHKLIISYNNLQSEHNILKFLHSQYLSNAQSENPGSFLELQAEKYSQLLKDSKKQQNTLNEAFTQVQKTNDIRLTDYFFFNSFKFNAKQTD